MVVLLILAVVISDLWNTYLIEDNKKNIIKLAESQRDMLYLIKASNSNWIDYKKTKPPLDTKILAYFDLCGQKRINVIKWSDKYNTWKTDMKGVHINPPMYWAKLPTEPKN